MIISTIFYLRTSENEGAKPEVQVRKRYANPAFVATGLLFVVFTHVLVGSVFTVLSASEAFTYG